MDRNAYLRQVFDAEREIVKTLIDYALLAGFEVGVSEENDAGWDQPIPPITWTRNADKAFAMLGSDEHWHTDDSHLYLRSAPSDPKPFGWVYLVFGNDGWDVISDHTTNISNIVSQCDEVTQKWEDALN